MTKYPRAHSSPTAPTGTGEPVIGAAIMTSVCGSGAPSVPVRTGSGSPGPVAVMIGEVSVVPKTMEIRPPNRRSVSRATSTGTGEPPEKLQRAPTPEWAASSRCRSLDQPPPAGGSPPRSDATVQPLRRDRLGGIIHEYV